MFKTVPRVDCWIIFYECATPAGRTSRGDFYGLAPNSWRRDAMVVRQLPVYINHN